MTAPAIPSSPSPSEAAQLQALKLQIDALAAKIGYVAPPPKTNQELVAESAAMLADFTANTHGARATVQLTNILAVILKVIMDILTALEGGSPTTAPTATPVVTAQSAVTAGGTIPVVPS
jgi:hypothetical protein